MSLSKSSVGTDARFVPYSSVRPGTGTHQVERRVNEIEHPFYAILDKFVPLNGQAMFLVLLRETATIKSGSIWLTKSTVEDHCLRSDKCQKVYERFNIWFTTDRKGRGTSRRQLGTELWATMDLDRRDVLPRYYCNLETRATNNKWRRHAGNLRAEYQYRSLYSFAYGFTEFPYTDRRFAYVRSWELFGGKIRTTSGYKQKSFELHRQMVGKLFLAYEDNRLINDISGLKCLWPTKDQMDQFAPKGGKSKIILFTAPSGSYILSPSVVIVRSDLSGVVYHPASHEDKQGINRSYFNSFFAKFGVKRPKVKHRYMGCNPTTEHIWVCYDFIGKILDEDTDDEFVLFETYASY